MQRRSRRALLGALAAGAVAGCLDGRSGGETPTRPEETIDTLAVGGSSGDSVPVRPGGRVVLLDFFATWCAPCKPQMEGLRQIRAAFPDVHMLSITWESDPGAIASFWRSYDGTWPVASDPEIRTGQRFGVDRLPTLVVFDAEGTERWRHVGLARTETLREQLRSAGASG